MSIERVIRIHHTLYLPSRYQTVSWSTSGIVLGCICITVHHNDCHGLLYECPSQSTDELHLLGPIHMCANILVGRDYGQSASGYGMGEETFLNYSARTEANSRFTLSLFFLNLQVLLAVGITAAVCLGLTLFAFQTKWDFTVMGGVLFVAAIVLMIFGIVAMLMPGRTMQLVYASVGALLFCVYLIYE